MTDWLFQAIQSHFWKDSDISSGRRTRKKYSDQIQNEKFFFAWNNLVAAHYQIVPFYHFLLTVVKYFPMYFPDILLDSTGD